MNPLNLHPDKKDSVFILIIFVLAIVLRLAYLADYRSTDIYPLLQDSDSQAYYNWGRDIASGDVLGSRAFMKWPLYAYFLAFFIKLSPANPIPTVLLFQFILGAVNCVLVYLIGKALFSRTAGFIAALLCASYGLFIFYEGLLIYTSFSIFLNLLLFLAFLYIRDDPSKKNIFWTGILLGFCTIAQGNILIFGITAAFLVLWQKRFSAAKYFRHFACFLLGAFLVVGAVTLRNYAVEKDFVLVAGNMGINFYLGNNPGSSGLFGAPNLFTPTQEGLFRESRAIAKIEMKREPKTSEVSRFWFAKSARFMAQNPFKYLKLLFNKIAYSFSPRDFIHDNEYAFIADKIGVFRFMFLDLRFIMPLAVLGMFLGLKRIKNNALLYLMALALLFSMAAFFVAARYRISAVPYLAVFAALGICSIAEALRGRRYARFGWLCVLLIALFAAGGLNVMAGGKRAGGNILTLFNHGLWQAKVYESKNDLPSAMRELKNAYALEPANHFVVLSLGSGYYKMGDLKAAEEKYRESLAISPIYIDAYYNLGFLYNQEGRFEEAAAVLKKAVFLDSEDYGAHFELGRAYKAMGDHAGAGREFGLALKKINRWRASDRAVIEKELAGLAGR